jgi:hypothetical protein
VIGKVPSYSFNEYKTVHVFAGYLLFISNLLVNIRTLQSVQYFI